MESWHLKTLPGGVEYEANNNTLRKKKTHTSYKFVKAQLHWRISARISAGGPADIH
jgi:hypothetical protein